MNALKHGRRSRKIARLREDSYFFEERLRKWMATGDARNDVEEFLMYRNVCLSFQIDQAERQRVARCETLIENSDDDEFAAIEALGRRLFFDPVGATSLYGNHIHFGQACTSFSGKALDENDPAVLVRLLERTEAGCCWLLDQFQELRSVLESLGFWQSHDRLKIIRLLGCQPVEANEDSRVAEVFLACHALHQDGETAFDDLLSDMSKMERDQYREALKVRWPNLYGARPPAEWRQMLFDLVDENIERLNEILEEHQQNADVTAERTYARLSFDPSAEGEALRNYLLKCTNALHRGLASYRKYKEQRTALPAWDRPVWDGIERRSADAHDPADPRASTMGAAAVIDLTKDRESAATIDSDGPNGREHAAAPAGATSSPADDHRVPEFPRDGSLAAGAAAYQPSIEDGDIAGNDGDQVSGHGEICGSMTNEPNFDETVVAVQEQDSYDVTANLGVESGLDNRVDPPIDTRDIEFREPPSELGGSRSEEADWDDCASGKAPPALVTTSRRKQFEEKHDGRAGNRTIEEDRALDKRFPLLAELRARVAASQRSAAAVFEPSSRSP